MTFAPGTLVREENSRGIFRIVGTGVMGASHCEPVKRTEHDPDFYVLWDSTLAAIDLFETRPSYVETAEITNGRTADEMGAFCSDDVLAMDITHLADLVSESYDGLSYLCTADEISALEWIGKRYSSAELLLGALDLDTGIVKIDTWAMAVALAHDDSDKIPCLSEETALQRLAWLCWDEETARGAWLAEGPYEDDKGAEFWQVVRGYDVRNVASETEAIAMRDELIAEG